MPIKGYGKEIGRILGENSVDLKVAQEIYRLLGPADASDLNEAYNNASQVPTDPVEVELTRYETMILKWMEVTKQDSCDDIYNGGNKTAIHWGRMWDMIDMKFGVRGQDKDVMGSSTREYFLRIQEYNWFCGRNRERMHADSPEHFTLDQWGHMIPANMPPLMKQWNDEFREIQESDKWKNKQVPYTNFWHSCLDGPFRRYRRDSVIRWDAEWFDLSKWRPAFWAHVHILDMVTKHHPARTEDGVDFLIWW